MEQFLTFTLNSERYGIEVRSVKEVLDPVPVTRVPKAESHLRGVLNLRGSVIPVLDPKIRFGIGECRPEEAGCFIVLDLTRDEEALTVAIMADDVDGVVNLADSDIEAMKALKREERSKYIRGIGKTGEGFIILLALDKFLSEEEEEEAVESA